MKTAALLLLALGLTGCASYPEQVQVPEGTNLVSFEQVSNQESGFESKNARWSGVIAGVTNHKSSTQLDILYYPSGSTGRPIKKNGPAGRFRIYTDKFLDPVVYEQGKSITVLGTVSSKEVSKIGEYEYEYPTLKSATVYLWPKEKARSSAAFYYTWYGTHPRWNRHARFQDLYVINRGGRVSNGKSKDDDK